MEENEEIGQAEGFKIEARKKYGNVHALTDLAKIMHEAKLEKEAADLVAKQKNAVYDVIRLELMPQRMEEQGMENFRVEGIGRIGLTADLYVSTKTGCKDDLFKWFRKQKLAAMITEAVNASTLKAFVKERMKKGKPIPEEFLNVTPYQRATITKA